MAGTAADAVFEMTASAVAEKRKLQRHFRRFDMFFYLICTVVTLDTVGAVAANGAQGFTWLVFLGIFFLLPYALSIAELGSAFPQEGGPYVWTRLAFGRPLAAVNSVIYWISNPLWVGGSLTIVSFAAIEEFFGTIGGGWKYLYAVAFIWFVVGAAIVSLRYGKWVPTLGAWSRGVLLAFFIVTVIIYAARNGVHGFGGHDFVPTYALFIAVVPVLIFNYAGMEVPSAAAEEMTNPRRDVPFSILWSGTATILSYGIPILLILIVLPVKAVTGLTGFLDAVKAVFTVYGGHVTAAGSATLTGGGLVLGRIAAVVFIFALASAGTTWIMGSDRTEAIAAIDGGGPRLLGRFSERFGTPAGMNIVSGLVATVLMIAAFQITGANSSRYFEAVLGLTISTTTISYMFIFPALVRLRYSRPEVDRPYRVPGGMAGAWICTVLPTFWAVVATVFLLWPGLGVNWFGAGGNPNDSLAFVDFSHQRLQYELTQFVPLAVIVAVGVVFYFLGRPTRQEAGEAAAAGADRRGGRHQGGRRPGPAVTRSAPFGFTRAVFLSHVIDDAVAVFPGDPPVRVRPAATIAKDGYYLQSLEVGEQSGTHWAAPAHFGAGQLAADELDPEDFFHPAVVVDVRPAVAGDPDYALSVADIGAWEADFGLVPPHAAVLMRTGFDDRWGDPAAYLNADPSGRMHYPGFSAEAARWLINERSAGALGADTMGIDPGLDTSFSVNRLLLQDHRIHLENLTGLGQLPPAGAWIITAGLRVRAGSGSPATVLGLIP